VKKIFALIAVVVILAAGSFSIVAAKDKGGCGSCCIGACFGTRVGYMYNEGVKIRAMEWYDIICNMIGMPIPRLIMLYDIYTGKTWSEVESAEGL